MSCYGNEVEHKHENAHRGCRKKKKKNTDALCFFRVDFLPLTEEQSGLFNGGS